MIDLYQIGRVQEVINRIFSVALRFDKDSSLACWAFAQHSKELPSVTSHNVRGYVNREAGGWTEWMKQLNTEVKDERAIIRKVIQKYRSAERQPLWQQFKASTITGAELPAYVSFVSDNGRGDSAETEKLLFEASALPIFWQFVGIGGSDYEALEGFDLEHFYHPSDPVVDNCNFISLDEMRSLSDKELHERLLNTFSSWLDVARGKGMILEKERNG
jgi:hypothetical protein